jgi:hypothetical protein
VIGIKNLFLKNMWASFFISAKTYLAHAQQALKKSLFLSFSKSEKKRKVAFEPIEGFKYILKIKLFLGILKRFL